MLRRVLVMVMVVGCGSSAPAPSPASSRPDVASISPERAARLERERRSDLATAHRELEVEQQRALAATCASKPTDPPTPRCEPSCYRAEAADPRAGNKLGRAEIMHLVCRRSDEGETSPFVFADEIGSPKLSPAHGRMPAPHKKGSWEAEVETVVAAALQPELARGDVVRVTGGWKTLSHPVTKERLRCVTVAHHVKAMRRALDGCGARGGVACEATGNAAVHGVNVVHFRLAEARAAQAAGTFPVCQRASLEAIAVARGLPRWRQYVSLNVGQWKAYPRYRTRFDGVLDEETLFATATALGTAAQALHAECGGPANPRTTAEQEQSFHTCW